MKQIKDFEFNNTKFEIYLTEETITKSEEVGLHEGIFLGATTRLISRIKKQENTYFYAEQNVLFQINAEEPNKIVFLDIKRLNVFDRKAVNPAKDPINKISRPSFFKSYENGRKVFLNEQLPLKMRNLGIPPHLISFRNTQVPDGNHSMYENGAIIDFYHQDDEFYITDIIKPDYVNFGLAFVNNSIK
ncbi:hypothetical protein [Bacillus toyonensis]|uniref:hypothetical protein n=1 Tax=Bacillus toyonensis TaxID=155322 RepID=UPI002E1FE351|nr:hypothetical protein [Bacillus toyonensis]